MSREKHKRRKPRGESPSALKSLDHLAQHVGAIGKGAQLPNLSRTTSIGHCNGNRRLVYQMA